MRTSKERLRTLRKTVDHFARVFQREGGASGETVKELFEVVAVLQSLESPDETPAVRSGVSPYRFAIECEGCKRGVIITLGQGVVLGYQCSCGHYTKLRDAEKANAGYPEATPPPGGWPKAACPHKHLEGRNLAAGVWVEVCDCGKIRYSEKSEPPHDWKRDEEGDFRLNGGPAHGD